MKKFAAFEFFSQIYVGLLVRKKIKGNIQNYYFDEKICRFRKRCLMPFYQLHMKIYCMYVKTIVIKH